MAVDEKTQEKLLERANETGFLLEHRAQKFFNEPGRDLKPDLSNNLRAWTSVPYVFPENNRGEIDVRGIAIGSQFREKHASIYTIECKRPMPQASNWLFFQKDEIETQYQMSYIFRGNPRDSHSYSIDIEQQIPRPRIFQSDTHAYVHQGIEIGDKFQSITQRSDERMYKPLLQAMRGTFATIVKPETFLDYLLERGLEGVTHLPVVLTSADLYVSHHKYSDISLDDGTLPADKQDFQRVDWVAYQFPVWDYLSATELKTDYLTIFIVKSRFLPQFVLGTYPSY